MFSLPAPWVQPLVGELGSHSHPASPKKRERKNKQTNKTHRILQTQQKGEPGDLNGDADWPTILIVDIQRQRRFSEPESDIMQRWWMVKVLPSPLRTWIQTTCIHPSHKPTQHYISITDDLIWQKRHEPCNIKQARPKRTACIKTSALGTPLMIQWLRLCVFLMQGVPGSIPGQGTRPDTLQL